ncbi:hypothetical protein RRG08_048822 [Elysia crispata]|uniref:Major facilitator superfamily (MFS) profile domain-containing protein n=1 Tax=Elysia crispata TaxID=231223 RepID=A0AAE1B533_9GAST|nr:hypothetical protein RRG08_048822 [Elysia crispata]
MPGFAIARDQIRFLADRLSSIRDRAGNSNSLALAIVFLTNLVDNLLLTSVVPVIPALLLQQDKQEFDNTNSALHSYNDMRACSKEALNLSTTEDELPPPVFSLTSVAVTENSRVGWLLSSKAVVQILANFLIGQLCNRIGYPLILLAGSFVIFMSSIVFAFAESYIPLLLARSLQGLGSAGTVVAGMSIVARRYPDDKSRSRAMGLAMSGGACGVLVGYPFGGFMYNFVGKTAAFLMIAVSILLDAGIQVFVFGIKVKTESYVTITPLYALLKDHYILIASGAVMLTTMSMSVLEPTVPLWVMSTMEVKNWELGLVFLPDSVGYLMGTNCFGLPARNMGRWMCTIFCMLLIALCLICLPFATSLPQLILPHFGLGLGLGITDAAVMPLLALLVDLRHEAFYGCVYAVVQLAVCLAYFVGPSVAGLLVSAVGFPWLMRGMALMNIVYCPLCYLLSKAPLEAEDGTLLSKDPTATPNYTAESRHTEIDEVRLFYGRLCEDDD